MIEEYCTFFISHLELAGFLESRASFYIDVIISFLALLPILSGVSIVFAIRKHLKLHQITQFLLFFLTLIALSLFAYFVHCLYGFDTLVAKSSIDATKVSILLVVHVIVSILTFVIWLFALIYALSDRKRRALPGVYSESHARTGKRVFKSIVLTALTSVALYWVFFIA